MWYYITLVMSDKVVATMTIEGFIDNAGINVKISPYVIKKYKTKYQSCFNLSKYINEKISNFTLNVNMIDSHLLWILFC